MTGGGSSIAQVQALLTVLATGKRAAEAGTAFGEGTKALARSAVSVVTVELDPDRAAHSRRALQDLSNVECLEGDWHDLLPTRAPFDLLFLDSTFKFDPFEEGRKAVDLLVAGGLLVVDDMPPGLHGLGQARDFLFGTEGLHSVEILTTPETAAVVSSKA